MPHKPAAPSFVGMYSDDTPGETQSKPQEFHHVIAKILFVNLSGLVNDGQLHVGFVRTLLHRLHLVYAVLPLDTLPDESYAKVLRRARRVTHREVALLVFDLGVVYQVCAVQACRGVQFDMVAQATLVHLGVTYLNARD